MSAGTDLTALLAEALRLHGTPLPNDGYPDDEYDCCAAHLASVLSAAYTITPKEGTAS